MHRWSLPCTYPGKLLKIARAEMQTGYRTSQREGQNQLFHLYVKEFVFTTLWELQSVLHVLSHFREVLLRTSVPSWRMWHKAPGDWIHSGATFCPKLICALCTDAKIIQFMECYANTHWTLWDSYKSLSLQRKPRQWENCSWYWLADVLLSKTYE